MPRKLGQHFLKNKEVIKKTIAALNPRDGDVIIEVGPGHGELTEELLQYPISVIAIEKDPLLADFLEKRFLTSSTKCQIKSEFSKLEIVRSDVLTALPELFRNSLPAGDVPKGQTLGIRNYKLVGNIPYYLTGHLFRVISDLPVLPERTVFMIQKEVAERVAALPPRMNLLAASVRFWSEPKIIATVSKNDFSPPPKVESSVILLHTLASAKHEKGVMRERYYRTVKLLFTQPRKTISNNLKGVLKEVSHPLPSADGEQVREEGVFLKQILERITRAGIPVSERPQNLSVGDIKKISEIVYNYKE